MIKRLVLFLAIAFSGLCLHAQSQFKPELNIGVGFGPTFSSSSLNIMNSRTTIDTKNLLQYHGGVSIRYITENHFGLIGEINFSQMGWEDKFDEEGLTALREAKYTRTLNYLEVPLLTHIYFGSDKARFFLNLGPKLGFLISEKESINEALQDYIDSVDPATTDALLIKHYGKDVENKIDYGITAGMGFELRTKFGYFTLEGRYYFGLADIFKSQKGEDFSRSANRVLSARLTYYTKIF